MGTISIVLIIAAVILVATAVGLAIWRASDKSGFKELQRREKVNDGDEESHRDFQKKALAGIIVAAIAAAICGAFAAYTALAEAAPQESNPPAQESNNSNQESGQNDPQGGADQMAASINEAATQQAEENKAASINEAQFNLIFPFGRKVVMSQESMPANYAKLRQATGISDAASLPPTTAEANENAIRADLTKENFSGDSSNTEYVLGMLSFFRQAYNTWFGTEPDSPELIRLTDLYNTVGLEAFVLKDPATGRFILTEDRTGWYINDDAKVASAMYKALFDEMVYKGVEDHHTLMNYHNNCADVNTDARIVENPLQYEGKFHVFMFVWKGQNIFEFGINCGSAEGPGDKRPALFAYPVEQDTPGGTTPGTPGGPGGNPPTNPPVNPPDTPQNYKDPYKDPVRQGDSPGGGGLNDDPSSGPFEAEDHPAKSEGASPDAGNDDGMGKPSNQVQNPNANQDGSNPPSVDRPIAGTGDNASTGGKDISQGTHPGKAAPDD